MLSRATSMTAVVPPLLLSACRFFSLTRSNAGRGAGRKSAPAQRKSATIDNRAPAASAQRQEGGEANSAAAAAAAAIVAPGSAAAEAAEVAALQEQIAEEERAIAALRAQGLTAVARKNLPAVACRAADADGVALTAPTGPHTSLAFARNDSRAPSEAIAQDSRSLLASATPAAGFAAIVTLVGEVVEAVAVGDATALSAASTLRLRTGGANHAATAASSPPSRPAANEPTPTSTFELDVAVAGEKFVAYCREALRVGDVVHVLGHLGWCEKSRELQVSCGAPGSNISVLYSIAPCVADEPPSSVHTEESPS